MTDQSLVERLNFQEKDVFLDGNKIFTVPLRDTKGRINLLGVPQHGRVIYVGSGNCCYGPISILENTNQGGAPNFQLDAIRVPDFNVFDIIPISVNTKLRDFGAGYGALLTTGYGCAGAGVKLIATYYPKTLEIVSEDEFKKMWNSEVQAWVKPHLRVDEQKRTISLDLLRSGYRLKAGRSRDPKLPTCLIDDAYETYVSQDIWTSKDLTSSLSDIGVDVEKTIEANRGYVRIRH